MSTSFSVSLLPRLSLTVPRSQGRLLCGNIAIQAALPELNALTRPSTYRVSQKKHSYKIFGLEIMLFTCSQTLSLKSVLVLLLKILGPFGPPKKRVNFVMSIFLSEAELLICSMS